MTTLFSLHLLLLLLHSFGETRCPLGWNEIGDKIKKCIRPYLSSMIRDEGDQRCNDDGGLLIDINDRYIEQDLKDILNGLYEDGLLEMEWIIQSDTRNEANIFQRINNTYKVGHTSPTSSLPFICSLNGGGQRMMLLRDELIPKGAPRITWDMRSEIFFSSSSSEMIPIRCPFNGNPQPKLTWYKNDVPLSDSNFSNITYLISGGTLLLTPSSSLSYSSFHCSVQSILGSARSPPIVLKPAFLDSFPSSRHDSFPLLDGGASLSCQPPPHQPKSLTYSWLVQDNEENEDHSILNEDERIFISIDGTLLFSHVSTQDDKRYSCSIRVPTTDSGHYGPFFRLVVPPNHIDLHFAPRIESNHPKVFPDVALRKETVYLECFAYGNPSPSYGWSRSDGRDLPSRSTLLNHGRILRIQEAESSDGGRYVCTAGNDRGVATAQVTLIIRDSPHIIIPLVDTLISTGETLIFDCPLSSADISSTMEWFRNDRPLVRILLSPNQRKRISTSGTTLRISPVELEDVGVYTCIASNDIGSTSSSALLEVRDISPHFPSFSLPPKIYAVKGTSLMIPCIYQASPIGHSHWTDVTGTVIGNEGRIRVNQRVLYIDNVRRSDEGPYFCTAHNRLGKDHIATHIIVIDSPDVRVSSNGDPSSSLNITCEVDLSCSSIDHCPEPFFQWTINDEPLQISPLRHIVTPHMKEKKIHGKKMRHKMDLKIAEGGHRIGRFACSSLYGSAKSEMGQWSALPPSPIGIRVERRKGKRGGISIRWNMPPSSRETRDNNDINDKKAYRVDGYIVEYRTKNDRRWKNISRRNIESMGERSANIEELNANTYYQFRVRSLASSTRGDASSPSEWIQTSPSYPIEPIQSLKWTAQDPQTLLVEWDPIEREYPSGADLRYRLSWGDAHKNGMQTVETRVPSAIIRVNSSESCSSIVLSVLPINNQGSGTVAASTVAFLNAKGELRDVSLVSITPLNSSAVNLSWKWEDEHYCHALYAVEINCTSPHSEPVTSSVSSELSSFDLTGLSPSLTYACYLRPFDKRGHYGKTSNTLLVSTERPPPDVAPGVTLFGWKQEDDGSLTTILEWTAVPFENGAGGNRTTWGYKVYIFISDTFTVFDMPEDQLTNPSKPSIRLEGLQPVYTYMARVAAYNAGGIGPQSEPKSIRLGLRHFQLKSGSPINNSSCTILLLLLLLTRILDR